MTLGGLALAVGILVDDATVTIENINWHLEQGKEVETSILDGAAQIVTPAFVSLLCICIVFVPMFFLQGVARFLFVPMAEAVMAAMVCSFHPVAHAGADHGELFAAQACRAHRPARARRAAAALAQSRGAVPARVRTALRALPPRLSRTADPGARPPRRLRGRLPGLRGGLVRAHALSRPRLLPLGRCRADPAARARARRHAYRRERESICRDPEGDPPDHSAARARHAGRQYRDAGQRHQHDLQRHRDDRHAGRRHPDQAARRPSADRRPCQDAARGAPAALPRRDVFVPSRRHHQPDPQFRRACPDRPADPRTRSRCELCLRDRAVAQAAPRARLGRRAHPAVAQRSPASMSTSTARAPNMSG